MYFQSRQLSASSAVGLSRTVAQPVEEEEEVVRPLRLDFVELGEQRQH